MSPPRAGRARACRRAGGGALFQAGACVSRTQPESAQAKHHALRSVNVSYGGRSHRASDMVKAVLPPEWEIRTEEELRGEGQRHGTAKTMPSEVKK